MRGIFNACLASFALYALPLAVLFAPHRWAVAGCLAALVVLGLWLARQMREGEL